jgi:hypothetical protein
MENDLNSTLQRNTSLETEVEMLRRKLKQQQDEMVNKRRQYLGEIESKNKLISSLRDELRTRARRSDGSILNKTEEIRRLNREAILNTNEEIRKLKSESILSVKKLFSQGNQGTVNTINIDSSKKWDVESELTQEHLDIPPMKQVPFSTRSNIIRSPMHLLGEDISMSYSSENDEDDDHNSPQGDTWRESLRKDSLSQRLESMYCKK